MQFSETKLSPEILRAVEEMGYTDMTTIQEQAIPLMLSGKDMIGRSSTGTGKTAAFGIPAVEMVGQEQAFSKKPQVLVLSPTRELAMQIADEMRKYSKYKHGVNIATVYGGQSFEIQIRQLKTANIVIGTPGRIMDHMGRRTLKLDEIKLVILDEADEMLNMGFLEDIQTILTDVPEERQTSLFSATMPPAIMKLTQQFQHDPELIAVDGGRRTLDTISQFYYQVPQARKMDALNLLIQMYTPARSVIFCNTKSMVDELTEYLNENGFKAMGLHGDMKQMMRTQVMNDFKKGRVNILVATDVAARGIDVEDIDGVFNFDIPQEYEYYIHRIGRTGRAGKTGIAYTLATNRTQVRKIQEIQTFVGTTIQEGELPTAEDILKKRREKLVLKIAKALDETAVEDYLELVDGLVTESRDHRQIAAALMGMVASRENKRAVPVVVGVKKTEISGRTQRSSDGKVRLRVSIGREQKVLPNHIVGAIVDGTGLPSRAIGKIDIFPDYTHIEMSPEDADLVLDNMQNSKIKGCKVTFAKADAEKGSFHGKEAPGKRFGHSKPRMEGAAPEKDYRSLSRKSPRAPGGFKKKVGR